MYHAILQWIWHEGRVRMMALALASLPAGPAMAQAPLAAQGCLGCHGPAGTGAGAIPALAGRPAGELVAAMQAYRDGTRPGTIMPRIAGGYTAAEIGAVAAFFAGQRP